MGRFKKVSIIIFAILVLLISLFLYLRNYRERKLISQGNTSIEKIEDFRIMNKRLPELLIEIGIIVKEQGPLFYNKIDSTKYTISFGYGVGESVNYSSETKKWDDY